MPGWSEHSMHQPPLSPGLSRIMSPVDRFQGKDHRASLQSVSLLRRQYTQGCVAKVPLTGFFVQVTATARLPLGPAATPTS